MASLGHNKSKGMVGGWCISEPIIWMNIMLRGQKEKFVGNLVEALAKRGHSTPISQCAGRLLGWSQGGLGDAHPNMDGEDSGKDWFRKENSTKET